MQTRSVQTFHIEGCTLNRHRLEVMYLGSSQHTVKVKFASFPFFFNKQAYTSNLMNKQQKGLYNSNRKSCEEHLHWRPAVQGDSCVLILLSGLNLQTLLDSVTFANRNPIQPTLVDSMAYVWSLFPIA